MNEGPSVDLDIRGGRPDHRRMRVKTGLRIGMLVAFLAPACATTGPNPCLGPASARPSMPCQCPGTTDPSCYPFPSDAKKPPATEGDRR
jgi:hypothetical protein